jgi:NADH-quinone oxidoreductase subunit J
MMNNIDTTLLVLMTLAAIWTVMGRSLLKATIGLAVTSAILSIIIFRLGSPLAAVFELSVCTGLITVVFVSTISLTKPLTHKDIVEMSKNRTRRFIYLPVILAIVGFVLLKAGMPGALQLSVGENVSDMRQVLWNMRQLDMFGQIILIVAGALGVVVLFTENKNGGK